MPTQTVRKQISSWFWGDNFGPKSPNLHDPYIYSSTTALYDRGMPVSLLMVCVGMTVIGDVDAHTEVFTTIKNSVIYLPANSHHCYTISGQQSTCIRIDTEGYSAHTSKPMYPGNATHNHIQRTKSEYKVIHCVRIQQCTTFLTVVYVLIFVQMYFCEHDGHCKV